MMILKEEINIFKKLFIFDNYKDYILEGIFVSPKILFFPINNYKDYILEGIFVSPKIFLFPINNYKDYILEGIFSILFQKTLSFQ